MAGGYNNAGAIGIPIGRRRTVQGSPTVEDGGRSTGRARRSPFVFVDLDGADVPGLVLHQRRVEAGWTVLVAFGGGEDDGPGVVSTRWFPASLLRPAVAPEGGEVTGNPGT